MATLYRLDAPAARIAEQFSAERGVDPWEGGYIAPGSFAPVIVSGRGASRQIVPRLWGVPPPASADPHEKRGITLVRNLESPFWIGTLRHTDYRCLVPVTSFQLWSDAPDPTTGKRVRHSFHLPATPLFALAGIWRDSEVPSFAILACEANRLVGAVHGGSMPVILHAEDHATWLKAGWKDARSLVTPFPSQLMASGTGRPESAQ